MTTKSKNEYVQGLKDGKDTFEQSKVKSRFQEIEKIRSQKEKKEKNLHRLNTNPSQAPSSFYCGQFPIH